VTPESAFDCLRVGWFTWKDVRDGQTGQKVRRQMAPLETPTNLPPNATRDISAALTALLADVFALCLKTKKFHWHISGRHFHDYHLLPDEQGDQLFATTDDIAERVRKIGGTTLRSIGQISRLQRVLDNDADYVTPLDGGIAGRQFTNDRVYARGAHAVRRTRRRGEREPA
jgi:Ferritin-like domain